MTEREVMFMAYRHEKTPWVPAPLTGQDICVPSAVQAGSRGYGITKDWLGVTYTHTEGHPSSMPIESEAVIKDIENWRDYLKFPNLDDYDWEGPAAIDTASWDRVNRMQTCLLINGLFESLHFCCGMQDALCYLLTNPDEVREFMEAMTDHKIEVIKYLKKYYNPDKITFHDDYGNAKNIFMSVECWRDLIKPSLKRIVDATHEQGMLYEHHSCGYVVPFIDDFIELGIDAWNPVQIFNDPAALQEKYAGKLTFVGGFNVDIDHIHSTEEEMRASMNNTLTQMSKLGSWVAAPGFISTHGYRNGVWVQVLDDWNRPLMAKYGVEPAKRDMEKITATVFRRYKDDTH